MADLPLPHEAPAPPPEEGTVRAPDGLRLYYRVFGVPEPSGTLIILHGHGEHIGRYEKFYSMLRDENLTIAGCDFRGHGCSEGPEVYVTHYDQYLDDFSFFMDVLKDRYPLKGKTILLGHSMGGLAAVHWAARHPERLQGLILSSPCLGLRLPPFLVSFNAVLNRYLPKFLYQNPVYPPHLTHNPEEVAQYKKDKLIKRRMSARLVHESLLAMKRLEARKAFAFPFPVYILAAGLEKIVDSSKTQLFFDKVRAPAKEMIVFPGFYHEIFNELQQQQAFDVLKNCIRKIKAG